MIGMLLCLDRRQRLVYVIGEILAIELKVAAEIMDVSPDNFRKLLQRARQDILNFMEEKCGLVNTTNPCRCSKKTKGFIKEGWVDPLNIKFTDDRLETIKDIIEVKNHELSDLENQYLDHFQGHTYLQSHSMKLVELIKNFESKGGV